jgi:hypothetical protein
MQVTNRFYFDMPDFNDDAQRNMIVMWAGSIRNIPLGWLLCDGTHGTPDLRSKFIMGADHENDVLVDSTGGSNEKTLTVNELPNHSHEASIDEHGHSMNYDGSHTHNIKSSGNHNHGIADEHGISPRGIQNSDNPGWKVDVDNRKSPGYITISHSKIKTTKENGSHTHSISTNPNHKHDITSSKHSHQITSTGSGQSFDNRPAYYSLAFIMKSDKNSEPPKQTRTPPPTHTTFGTQRQPIFQGREQFNNHRNNFIDQLMARMMNHNQPAQHSAQASGYPNAYPQAPYGYGRDYGR